MAEATVRLRGATYRGELLYLYTYPRKIADETGRVIETKEAVQRAGLLIDGVVTHFARPETVEVVDG